MTPELPAIGSMVDVQMMMEVTSVVVEKEVTKIFGKVKYGSGQFDYMGGMAPLVCCEVIDRVKEFSQ